MDKDMLRIVVDEKGYTSVIYKGTELCVRQVTFDVGVDRVATMNCEIAIPTCLGRTYHSNGGENKNGKD